MPRSAYFELEEFEKAKAVFLEGIALVPEAQIDVLAKYRRAVRKCEAEIECESLAIERHQWLRNTHFLFILYSLT